MKSNETLELAPKPTNALFTQEHATSFQLVSRDRELLASFSKVRIDERKLTPPPVLKAFGDAVLTPSI